MNSKSTNLWFIHKIHNEFVGRRRKLFRMLEVSHRKIYCRVLCNELDVWLSSNFATFLLGPQITAKFLINPLNVVHHFPDFPTTLSYLWCMFIWVLHAICFMSMCSSCKFSLECNCLLGGLRICKHTKHLPCKSCEVLSLQNFLITTRACVYKP